MESREHPSESPTKGAVNFVWKIVQPLLTVAEAKKVRATAEANRHHPKILQIDSAEFIHSGEVAI